MTGNPPALGWRGSGSASAVYPAGILPYVVAMRRRFPFSLAALLGMLAIPAAAADGGWRTYVNARYRYTLCYPAGFSPAAEAPNGDGRRFADRGGATLAVFGRNDVDGAGLDRTVADDAADLAGHGGHIQYRAGRGDWRVVSGTDASGAIFYSRTLRRGDQFAIFELHYPQAARARYAAVAMRLSRCFAMLR